MSDQPVPPPATDPMKGFRGVMSAMLILESIVVLLALLVVAKSDDVSSGQRWLVAGLALAMVLACGVVGRPWGMWVAVALQGLMVLGFFVLPALGAVGVLFGLAWAWMVWARQDVLKRMAEGRLSSQREA